MVANHHLRKATGLFGGSLMAFTLVVGMAAAQESTEDDGTLFGIEQGGGVEDPVMQALIQRQDRLESALRVFQGQLNELTEQMNAISARLARGDDPLVSLEIEQLWSMVRSLESENADLQSDIERLTRAAGE